MKQRIQQFGSPISIFFAVILIILSAGPLSAKDQTSGVICRVETDRRILPAQTSGDVVLKVTLVAPTVPNNIKRPLVNLAIVLDRSGSMNGTKMEQAKAAAIEAVNRLGAGDIFSAIVYDTAVDTIVPAQTVRNPQSIISRIKQIRPGGSTNLFGGVSQGAAEVRKNLEDEYVHRIVLLSDGLANVGPKTPADLGRLGTALIKENISVTTIGVGTDYNEDLMAQLAQNSDGNTYFVESGYDLPRIFSSELGDVLNVVAKKVKVIITLPDNISPVSIVGREGRISGNQIELYMNQLYGDQEKYGLIKVRVPALEEGQKIEIASVKATYENPFDQTVQKSTGNSYVEFSNDSKKVQNSVNVNVVKDYQLNRNALAQEKAIELSDKGKKKQAALELKKSADMMKSMGSLYNVPQLMEEAAEQEVQAEKVEKEGMAKKVRKSFRTKSYQQKNQQYSK